MQFVHVNNGITFHLAPVGGRQPEHGQTSVAVPIRDRIVNTATIDAITHASRQLPLAAEEFLRFLQGELQNLREPLSSAA